ncbi:MAG: hypothetical protein WC234_01925 [Endomicrobiaceae bacterium]
MKKIIIITAVLMTMVIIKAEGAFVDTYWGVRALGMGGAFTSVANDSNAPLYNIAGIANAVQQEVTLMGSRLFTGLEGVEIGANYFGYIHPMANENYGAISFAWSSISTPGLRREDTFNAGYARYLNDVMRIDREIVNITGGVNIKYLVQEVKFDEDDSDLDNSKGAVTGDIGILAQFNNGISLGYSNKYITSPDIGFVYEDKVSNVNVIGISYYNDMVPVLRIPYFTIATDILMRDGETSVRVGLETYVIEGKLAIRAGGREEAFDLGFGYEFVFGNNTKLIIDYALELPMEVEETMGSHFVGLSFRFD